MLTKLEKLEDYVYDCDIHIHNAHFSKTKKAACIGRQYKNIILDKQAIESNAEEGMLLAEELGHYETEGLFVMNADVNSVYSRFNRGKQEVKARHFSYMMYISASDIRRAAEWCGRDDYAIAEYMEVSVEDLRKAIRYYLSIGMDFSFIGDFDIA